MDEIGRIYHMGRTIAELRPGAFTKRFIVRNGRAIPPQPSTLNWPQDSNAFRPFFVTRALPYPDRGAAGCKWRREDSPSGRRMLVPVA